MAMTSPDRIMRDRERQETLPGLINTPNEYPNLPRQKRHPCRHLQRSTRSVQVPQRITKGCSRKF
eukprot:3321706-Prymnesium_polylepis.1